MNKVLLAFVSGFLAGILLAPDKGTDTRKKLGEKMDDLSDSVGDLVKKFTPEKTDGTKRSMSQL